MHGETVKEDSDVLSVSKFYLNPGRWR